MRHRGWLAGTALGAALVLAIVWWQTHAASVEHVAQRGGALMPVQVAAAHYGDMQVQIEALGTVVARTTATITPRVDGLLQHVLFREGQLVKANDVLEVLDPRPFQVVVDQWVGQLLHDQALLDDARLDLARYQKLLAQNSIGSQQVDTQLALVRQDEGTVKSDQAQLANARLQLDFSRVTAPVTGRVGLRLVDEGNMVHAAATTGLVVITQTQPIDAVFPVPSDLIGLVLPGWQHGQTYVVDAYDRDDRVRLASGRLLAVDNVIDPTTGTAKFKATFANRNNRLFPSEFVNIHLQAGVHQHVLLVPVAAIQSGSKGDFVFVVDAHHVVHVHPVTLGPVSGETASVLSGVRDGDQVVTDGVDRLREGSKVFIATPEAASEAAPEAAAQPGAGHGNGHHAGDTASGNPA